MFYAEFILSIMISAGMVYTSSVATSDLVPLFAGGAVAWTLAEYTAHRWVLHDFAPKPHYTHHADPLGNADKLFWEIWLGFNVVYAVAGGAVLAGVLAAYAWYLFVHRCAHHARHLVPMGLLQHHDGHHKWATRNFGVSTTLWDHVFGSVLR